MLEVNRDNLMRLINSPPYGGTIEEQRSWLRALMQGLGVRGQRLAVGAGIAPSTVNRFLSDRSNHRLRPRTLDALVAEASRLSSDPHAAAPPQTKQAPSGSEGPCSVTCCKLEDFAPPAAQNCTDPEIRSFDRGFLLSLEPTSLDNLALVLASGDSMLPTITRGDQLLVDCGVRTIRQDGLYLLRAGGLALLRRITLDPLGGMARVTTDNPAYPSPEDCALDRLEVAGLVRWVGRRL